MLALCKMKSLKYLGMLIFLSVVKSDSEDICTINHFQSFGRPSVAKNAFQLQFVASYVYYSKNRTEWINKCTASVLTKRTLLTAAHCVREFDKQENFVVVDLQPLVGAKDLNSDTPSNYLQEMSISRVVRHPDYDNVTAYFDIAIIHTDEDIEFDNEFGVKPACLSNETFKTTDFLRNEVTRINLKKNLVTNYRISLFLLF